MLDLIGKISMATVRGLMALGGFGTVSYLAIEGSVKADDYIKIILVIIGFYFGTRGKNE